MNQFTQLPESSRIWIFPLSRAITAGEKEQFSKAFSAFIAAWKSHADEVSGAFSFVEDRFLIVAADQDVCHVSGCSIDSLFKAAKTTLSELGVELANYLNVFLQNGSGVKEVTRTELKELIGQGSVTSETIVYDPSLVSLKDFREGSFLKKFSESSFRGLL